jgi:hypothetical protein
MRSLDIRPETKLLFTALFLDEDFAVKLDFIEQTSKRRRKVVRLCLAEPRQ